MISKPISRNDIFPKQQSDGDMRQYISPVSIEQDTRKNEKSLVPKKRDLIMLIEERGRDQNLLTLANF